MVISVKCSVGCLWFTHLSVNCSVGYLGLIRLSVRNAVWDVYGSHIYL